MLEALSASRRREPRKIPRGGRALTASALQMVFATWRQRVLSQVDLSVSSAASWKLNRRFSCSVGGLTTRAKAFWQSVPRMHKLHFQSNSDWSYTSKLCKDWWIHLDCELIGLMVVTQPEVAIETRDFLLSKCIQAPHLKVTILF